MVMENNIILQNISKTYKNYNSENVVLKEVSLKMLPGQINILCGLNGSGKTTLLKIIAGILDKDSAGKIINDERECEIKYLRNNVLFIPQNIDDAFVENLYLYEYINVFSVEDVMSMATEISANWIIDNYVNKNKILLKEFSQGERQLLLLLVLLSMKEKIILFDEVLSSIDALYQDKLWTLIKKKIISDKKYSLIITHNYKFAYENCQRAIILFRGENVYDGNVSNISYEQFISMILKGKQ